MPAPTLTHGRQLAEWMVTDTGALRIQYVIWEQKIWNINRADEGWRAMGDRGGITANHSTTSTSRSSRSADPPPFRSGGWILR